MGAAFRPLLKQAKRVLASSRSTAQSAHNRISDSRKRLSESEDTVVASASCVGGARSVMRKS